MVTATNLASYLYCPRKLFLSNVLCIEEPPKEALVKGKIWHETYETLNDSQENIVTSLKSSDYQEVFDIYRKIYSKILRDVIIRNKPSLSSFGIPLTDMFGEYWSHFEEEAKDHALNVCNFMNKYDLRGKELWDKLTPKILSEQYFRSERLNLSGVIDVLEIHDMDGNKLFVPVELKTGKFPDKGMWDGHRIQLAAYMLLLEDSGKKTGEGVLKYKGCEKRVLQMNTFLKDEVLSLIKKTSAVLSNFEIPEFAENRNKCNSCHFKDKCYNQDVLNVLLEKAKTTLKSA